MTSKPTTRVANVGAGVAQRVLRALGWVLLIAVLLFVLGVLWGPNLT
jgi:hypothetical protein